MSNKYVLLYLKTFGVKCIEKPIEIYFANKKIDGSSFDKPLIKAIYGTNGEGKTAVAHTLDIYKNTVLNPSYITGENYIGTFKELVNHNTKKIYIELYFANVINNNESRIFHHIIEYILEGKELSISHETLHLVRGQSWGSSRNEELIYETSNGELIDVNKKVKDKKSYIESFTKNLLSNSSAALSILSATIFGTKEDQEEFGIKSSFGNAVMSVVILVTSMKIYIDKKDQHTESYDRAYSLIEKVDSNEKGKSGQRFIIDNEVDEIYQDYYEDYKKEIKRICEFLKVFKPNLKDIRVECDIKGDKYICKKVLVYSDKEVSSEYESNGVKKLISLFPYLNSVEDNDIVFIDEFDSNIHDVYLCKLIEYFVGYTKGQFIFTTHNLGPMEILKDAGLKHSIDFINNGIVTSWKRNGNYSVVSLYRNGMIPNSPFNINAVDFVKVFGGNSDD